MKYLLCNKKLVFSGLLLIFFFLISSTMIVSAHSPSDMNIVFDKSTNELEVAITHQVEDPTVHYIDNVVIKVNDETVIDQEYTSQSGSSLSYTYTTLNVSTDDIIDVSAYCNQGGTISKQLTITSDETSSDDESTPGFGFFLFLGTCMIMVLIFKKDMKK